MKKHRYFKVKKINPMDFGKPFEIKKMIGGKVNDNLHSRRVTLNTNNSNYYSFHNQNNKNLTSRGSKSEAIG